MDFKGTAQLPPEHRLSDDLGANSLDMMHLLLELEDEFSVADGLRESDHLRLDAPYRRRCTASRSAADGIQPLG